MANRLILGLKTFAAPGNVERKYASSVGGTTATLTHYLEKAKTAVKEESGFVEFELATGTEGPSSATTIIGSTSQKYLLNVSDISSVVEY